MGYLIKPLTQTEPGIQVFNEFGKTVVLLREPCPPPRRDPEWNDICDLAGKFTLILRKYPGF
jgi:hypothetical protein